MKKIGYLLLCALSLTAMEYVLLVVFIQVEDSIKYAVSVINFGETWWRAGEVIYIRFVFYTIFWVLGMLRLYDKINIRHPVLKMSVINCMLYIAISVLMALVIPGTAEFFKRDFFYFLVAATFISPFVLSIIPYLNKIVTKL